MLINTEQDHAYIGNTLTQKSMINTKLTHRLTHRLTQPFHSTDSDYPKINTDFLTPLIFYTSKKD